MVVEKKNMWLKRLNPPNTIKILLFIIPNLLFGFEKKEGDFIVKEFEPPNEYWEVEGGSCGEAVLETVFKKYNLNYSQKKINLLAGNPKRGIYSNEVLSLLVKLKIPHKNISTRTTKTEIFIKEKLIEVLKNNHSIFFGVKIYPDEYPKWAVDHFILLVGYNEKTNELIYNSFNERKRIKISKLLNSKEGYSLVHRSNYIYAIEFLL